MNGDPLPFANDLDVERFLEAAKILSREEIPVGVTHPQKLLLEHGGVRAHAILRWGDIHERRKTRRGKEVVLDFRDSYTHELAAYELSELLHLDAVPPVVARSAGKKGSVQIWIEHAMTRLQRMEEAIKPPDWLAYQRQIRLMAAFDNLIDNIDRNAGNVLIDSNWRVWLIDHTRAFSEFHGLFDPKKVAWIERDFWQRLQEVSDDEIRQAVAPYLNKSQTAALLSRRAALVELIRGKIAELGEAAVVY
jgi:hypothetical protein